ncbi:hypothetical protein GN244_ATG11913 [Phytophthora infestans]|uniref:SAM domain-containing protein n=2 Tax=Phytophthora infestans TaxID=4787 RepID=A0A833WT18_PHYIN|nr:hypothetical protein GN244_ATG11913 [Phytophthora infestans]KAI9979696.1 hypothetical protein PInf_028072 [Phytophthora infestans]KAI9990226.1 hypothetical protein PInf_021035 [Phytophthora infestans]KAI9997935.1 hypothetical protein PInf_002193 [Phytophthora infestans]
MASTQTMKTVPMSPRAAPRATVPVKPERRVAIDVDPQVQQQKKQASRLEEEGGASPRVRRRLSDAQESATIFSMVCEQGEVIQWMTACHPDLTAFGVALERRGYRTLSSIVFLTEEDVECVTNSDLRQLLLTTLSRLRHELFRM